MTPKEKNIVTYACAWDNQLEAAEKETDPKAKIQKAHATRHALKKLRNEVREYQKKGAAHETQS